MANCPNCFPYRAYGDDLKPIGPIAMITDQVDPRLADAINRALRQRRLELTEMKPELEKIPGFLRQDYRIPVDLKRFLTGEGQASIINSVRGHDLFIITDVLNTGRYQTRFNNFVPLGPDEHFQDLVRLISATHGITNRISLVMPYLYEGRRYRRSYRGSLDCAQMLRTLFDLGVTNFITFEAHDPRVANAVPQRNFENFKTALQLIEAILEEIPDLDLSDDRLMVVSPNETSISRAIYFASHLQVPLCSFYRRYDKDSIRPNEAYGESVALDFLGDDVAGKDILLVDDMIDTGKTMCNSIRWLKEHGASRIYVAVTYALFSRGFEDMNQLYDFGMLDRVFASNLYHHQNGLRDMPWFKMVDFSDYLSKIIDSINFDASLADLISPNERITKLLEKHRQK